MKTNLRERLTRYQCVIRPKVNFVPELSFKHSHWSDKQNPYINLRYWISQCRCAGLLKQLSNVCQVINLLKIASAC